MHARTPLRQLSSSSSSFLLLSPITPRCPFLLHLLLFSPQDLLQLATAMRGGVRIKDRRYLFRCYRACFVGQEAVAWLVAAGAAAGPAEAVALGNRWVRVLGCGWLLGLVAAE